MRHAQQLARLVTRSWTLIAGGWPRGSFPFDVGDGDDHEFPFSSCRPIRMKCFLRHRWRSIGAMKLDATALLAFAA